MGGKVSNLFRKKEAALKNFHLALEKQFGGDGLLYEFKFKEHDKETARVYREYRYAVSVWHKAATNQR